MTTSVFQHIVTTQQPAKLEMIHEGKVGARLATYGNGMQAVVKIAEASAPKKQSRTTQCGLPIRSLPRREVAFYRLAKLLGFESVVPETVLGAIDGESASFQQYVQAVKLYELAPRLKNVQDHDAWVVAFREAMREVPREDVVRLTLLDFIAGQRDRHGANYGVRIDIKDGKARWRLVGWDNGVAFGKTFERYKSVAHKYLFQFSFNIENEWSAVENMRRSELDHALDGLLLGDAIEHTWLRAQFVLAYPYRLPWCVLSQGAETDGSFPAYETYFNPLCPDGDTAKTSFALHLA